MRTLQKRLNGPGIKDMSRRGTIHALDDVQCMDWCQAQCPGACQTYCDSGCQIADSFEIWYQGSDTNGYGLFRTGQSAFPC